MMKISKPFTIDSCLSSVQFTSLNSIIFRNVKPLYYVNEKICLEYEYQPKVVPSARDWIGIFPRGWSTLQQYATFEWVSQAYTRDTCPNDKENEEESSRRTIIFLPKFHHNTVNQHTVYQFVYVSKQIEVLGVSSYFRFDLSVIDNPVLECLKPVSSSMYTTSSDFGNLIGDTSASHTAEPTPATSRQNLPSNDKAHLSWPNSSSRLEDSHQQQHRLGKTAFCSHSEPLMTSSPTPLGVCRKCMQYRRNNFTLRSQEALQSKLKIVMERNKTLEERTQEMKKEKEKFEMENKRLKMTYYTLNKEKVAYEKFVKDFIKSLEKDSIVRVMNGNTEILVKKINYVGMEEHPRDKKTSKRERELKAVIGLQEITIRNLITNLQERAKTSDELQDTVKLAKQFAEATRDEDSETVSDQEEAMEIHSSDVNSEYQFGLKDPEPPEGMDRTEEDLEELKRTTEIELRGIGINRKLTDKSCNDSDHAINVPRLKSEKHGSRRKKLHRITSMQQPEQPFWSFDNITTWPRPPSVDSSSNRRQIRRKVSKIKLTEEEKVEEIPQTSECEEEEPLQQESESTKSEPMEEATPEEESVKEVIEEQKGMVEVGEKVEEKMVNLNVVEEPEEVDDLEKPNASFHDEVSSVCTDDFYDCSSMFSPRDFSQLKTIEECQGEQKTIARSKSLENLNRGCKDVTTQSWKIRESTGDWVNSISDTGIPNENIPKKKKFTCQLSIDLNPVKISDKNKQTTDTQIKSKFENDENVICMNKESSLVTFKQSSKHLEIKITRVASDENIKQKSFHQKMVVKFGLGDPTPVVSEPLESEIKVKDEEKDEYTSVKEVAEQSTQCLEEKEILTSDTTNKDTEQQSDDLQSATSESYEENKTVSDASSKCDYADAKDIDVEVNEDSKFVERPQIPENYRREAPPAKKLPFENTENRRKLKYLNMLNDDSLNNLRIYRDSFMLEKNMEYFQKKEQKEDVNSVLEEIPEVQVES